MKWDCDDYIQRLVVETKNHIKEHIDTLYIITVGKANINLLKETDKTINNYLLNEFLKKRGYTMNYLLGKQVMTKDFTVVYNAGNCVEVWHDVKKNNTSIFIADSLLTSLPVALNYMERI